MIKTKLKLAGLALGFLIGVGLVILTILNRKEFHREIPAPLKALLIQARGSRLPPAEAVGIVFAYNTVQAQQQQDLLLYQSLAKEIVREHDQYFWISELRYIKDEFEYEQDILHQASEVYKNFYDDLRKVVNEPIASAALEDCKKTKSINACNAYWIFLSGRQPTEDDRLFMCENGVDMECGKIAAGVNNNLMEGKPIEVKDIQSFVAFVKLKCRSTGWYGCNALSRLSRFVKINPDGVTTLCAKETIDGCFEEELQELKPHPCYKGATSVCFGDDEDDSPAQRKIRDKNLKKACAWGSYTACDYMAFISADTVYWMEKACKVFPEDELNPTAKHDCERVPIGNGQ